MTTIVHRSAWWRRWRVPILGVALCVVGFTALSWVPDWLDLAKILLFGSGALCIRQAQKSMLFGVIRLLLLGAFATGVIWAFQMPLLSSNSVYWLGMTTIGVGALGDLLPLKFRKQIYGLILASIWVVLISAWIEEYAKSQHDKVFAISIGGLLVWMITALYVRWARTGELPEVIRNRMFENLSDDQEKTTLDGLSDHAGVMAPNEPVARVRTISQ